MKNFAILLAALMFAGSAAYADKPLVTDTQKAEAPKQTQDLKAGRIPRATPSVTVNVDKVKEGVAKAQREAAAKKMDEKKDKKTSTGTK